VKQRVTLELDVPDGWEATGEWRPPEPAEPYLDPIGQVVKNPGRSIYRVLILRRKLPETVMVEMSRVAAEYAAGNWRTQPDTYRGEIGRACAAALAKEAGQ
jgi:hypothetical protein